MYEKFLKRVLDFVFSLLGFVILSPIILVLVIVGAIAMRGNPFFTQARPGKISSRTGKEKIFNLVKFRTMSNKKDAQGNLLPDEQRLIKSCRILRSTSLDELPELWNILKGDMSIVGPRPLLVKYLPRYSKDQRRRHEVRPGLTGLAQVNGRNAITWEKRFEYDVEYVNGISFILDLKILFKTVSKVFKSEGINSETSVTMEEFMGYEVENGENE